MSLSVPAPKIVPWLLLSVQHPQRWGCLPCSSCLAQKLHRDLMALDEGLMGLQEPFAFQQQGMGTITGDSCLLREHKQSSPV